MNSQGTQSLIGCLLNCKLGGQRKAPSPLGGSAAGLGFLEILLGALGSQTALVALNQGYPQTIASDLAAKAKLGVGSGQRWSFLATDESSETVKEKGSVAGRNMAARLPLVLPILSQQTLKSKAGLSGPPQDGDVLVNTQSVKAYPPGKQNGEKVLEESPFSFERPERGSIIELVPEVEGHIFKPREEPAESAVANAGGVRQVSDNCKAPNGSSGEIVQVESPSRGGANLIDSPTPSELSISSQSLQDSSEHRAPKFMMRIQISSGQQALADLGQHEESSNLSSDAELLDLSTARVDAAPRAVRKHVMGFVTNEETEAGSYGNGGFGDSQLSVSPFTDETSNGSRNGVSANLVSRSAKHTLGVKVADIVETPSEIETQDHSVSTKFNPGRIAEIITQRKTRISPQKNMDGLRLSRSQTGEAVRNKPRSSTPADALGTSRTKMRNWDAFEWFEPSQRQSSLELVSMRMVSRGIHRLDKVPHEVGQVLGQSNRAAGSAEATTDQARQINPSQSAVQHGRDATQTSQASFDQGIDNEKAAVDYLIRLSYGKQSVPSIFDRGQGGQVRGEISHAIGAYKDLARDGQDSSDFGHDNMPRPRPPKVAPRSATASEREIAQIARQTAPVKSTLRQPSKVRFQPNHAMQASSMHQVEMVSTDELRPPQMIHQRLINAIVEHLEKGKPRHDIGFELRTDSGDVVRVRMSVVSNVVRARIAVTSTQLREALVNHSWELNQRLELQGFIPDDFEFLLLGDRDDSQRRDRRGHVHIMGGDLVLNEEEEIERVEALASTFDKWA